MSTTAARLSYCDPWHGQLNRSAASLHGTAHPRWVHFRYAATIPPGAWSKKNRPWVKRMGRSFVAENCSRTCALVPTATGFPRPSIRFTRMNGATSAPISVAASPRAPRKPNRRRSEEHTSELQSPYDLVCRLLLEKKKVKDLYKYIQSDGEQRRETLDEAVAHLMT